MSVRTFASKPEASAAPVQWTEGIIIHAAAKWLDWRTNVVIPNVYVDGSLREIDLAVITKANLLWALEIKTSLADWKRDLTKSRHSPRCAPARFYYLVPVSIMPVVNGKPSVPDWVPADAGVVSLENYREFYTQGTGIVVVDTPKIQAVRRCKALHRRPVEPRFKEELIRKLGFRYWAHVFAQDFPQAVTIEPTKETA